MGFRIQTICAVALLSSCSIVNDFDFEQGDVGTLDVGTLDADTLDVDTLDDASTDVPSDSDVPTQDAGPDVTELDSGPLAPLVLTGLSLEVDETPVAFDERFEGSRFNYDAGEVGFFVREVILRATTAATDAVLRVDGNVVASDEPVRIELGLGDTRIRIALTRGEEPATTYTLDIERDNELQNIQYIKGEPVSMLSTFGRTVATAGDILVIGAPSEGSARGAAYIFRREDSAWSFVQRIEGITAASTFGDAVATDGDLIVVGAPEAGSGAGAVYVYSERSGSTWVVNQVLISGSPEMGGRFGASIALDGPRLAVGATGADAVYSFALDGNWGLVETLVPPDGIPAGADFGSALVMRDDTLIVAADREDAGGVGGINPMVDGNSSRSGAVFVYRRGAMRWIEPTYLKAFAPQSSDRFGSSIAFDGDLLAVGAVGESSSMGGVGTMDDEGAGRSNSGAVYTFRRDAEGMWATENYIKAESPVSDAAFGTSVALWGNLLFVGEPNGGIMNSGSVSLYVHSNNSSISRWSHADLSVSPPASDQDSGDKYGVNIAVSSHGFVAGASNEDGDGINGPENNGRGSSGAAYSFEPTPSP